MCLQYVRFFLRGLSPFQGYNIIFIVIILHAVNCVKGRMRPLNGLPKLIIVSLCGLAVAVANFLVLLGVRIGMYDLYSQECRMTQVRLGKTAICNPFRYNGTNNVKFLLVILVYSVPHIAAYSESVDTLLSGSRSRHQNQCTTQQHRRPRHGALNYDEPLQIHVIVNKRHAGR